MSEEGRKELADEIRKARACVLVNRQATRDLEAAHQKARNAYSKAQSDRLLAGKERKILRSAANRIGAELARQQGETNEAERHLYHLKRRARHEKFLRHFEMQAEKATQPA